jgi:parallel beta-helix repeat protein
MKRTSTTWKKILFILLTITSIMVLPTTLAGTTSDNILLDRNTSFTTSVVNDSLQEAINRASPESTLQLEAATYTEILVINKPLHLSGRGSMDTCLNVNSAVNGYAIVVSAEGVTISNLTIINQGPGLYTTGIKVCADHTIIRNCTFSHTPIGIALWTSTNTISNCEFNGCDDEGIALLGTEITPCSNNIISSCTFHNNCDGIELQYATHNSISSCMFAHNTHAGLDLIVSNNTDNTISHCMFQGNEGFGLYLAKSSQNRIIECSFSNDTVLLVHASENTIQKSQIQNIQLINDSYLRMENCEGIEESLIVTRQSSYEIVMNQPDPVFQEKHPQRMTRYKFLSQMLLKIKVVQFFYTQLHRLPM